MINRTQEEIMQDWGVDNSDTPLVSVRCITYNHEPYIAQALDGFLMQKTNFPFEVIVHDDASPDKTADIIREYEAKFPKIIKPIYETENQYSKHDGSLGRIMDAACKGKYIALCEGDDYWIDENKLQLQVDFLEGNSEYGMCYSKAKILQNNTFIDKEIPNLINDCTVRTESIIRGGGMYVPSPSIVYRKSIKNIYPDFCNNCWVGDYPLQLFFALKSKIYFFSSTFVVYRQNSIGSWSSRINASSFFEKRKGIESELITINNFNQYSNYKYNDAFMKRKIVFIGRYFWLERRFVFEGKNSCFYFIYAIAYSMIKVLMKMFYRLK